jgi:hypothetical protein
MNKIKGTEKDNFCYSTLFATQEGEGAVDVQDCKNTVIPAKAGI